jgi:6-phosphogluconate dehydrogenase
MKIGVLGLGKMGNRIAQKLLLDGHKVSVWNRSEEPLLDFEDKNKAFKDSLRITKSIEELVESLDKPRILWLMLPSGDPTNEILSKLKNLLDPKDVVIDGGNAYFKDTQKWFEEFEKFKIKFLGIGVSGGLKGFDEGYPLMVGGSKEAYEYIKPILISLAEPKGGYEYFGQGGAGHFVKMVHNGIEYGLMQSLAEGFGVLDKSSYNLDLLKIAKLWRKNTLVSGFMLDRVVDVLNTNPKLSKVLGYIEESGEAAWTVEEAKKEGVTIEIIERSLDYRRRSQKDKSIQESFTAKMVAALRMVFGGHKVKETK